jgi:hypothetical protein
MNTITKLQEKFGSTDLDHLLDAYGDIDIPVITGEPQHQGDLFVIPMRDGEVKGLVQVPKDGIAVIRGEAGGNTHLLLAEGEVLFAPSSQREGVVLGTLRVKKGATAILHHIEHGYNLIGEGLYSMRGKRTQMNEIRRVAD